MSLGINLTMMVDFLKQSDIYMNRQTEQCYIYLISKARNLKLPVDIQLELFDSLTCPVLLYGCEVWGCENIMLIEKQQKEFFLFYLG